MESRINYALVFFFVTSPSIANAANGVPCPITMQRVNSLTLDFGLI